MYGQNTCVLQWPMLLTYEDCKFSSVWTYFHVCLDVDGGVLYPCSSGKFRSWWALQWVSPHPWIVMPLLQFTSGIFPLPSISLKNAPLPSTLAILPWSDELVMGFGMAVTCPLLPAIPITWFLTYTIEILLLHSFQK